MTKASFGKFLDEVQAKLPEGISLPVVAGTAAGIVGINIAIRVAKSIKRDATGNTFGSALASINILSNKDSVLKRDKVKESMDDYDNLFSGARKDVGSLHKEESISTRQKEYKTMINNFYDLVTDFYEWGWGQVSLTHTATTVTDAPAVFLTMFHSRSTSDPARKVKPL